MTRTTLVVTNDFPPRQGGIQSFVYELAIRQPAGSLVVYASDHAGAAEFDAQQPFPVVRHPTGLLVPTPLARRGVVETARRHGASAVWFGASAPLGLLAPVLRGAGVKRVVASTHGHEIGWARLPGARQLMRRIATGCDVLTYLGEYTRSRIAGAVDGRAELVHLPPGVDIETFHPDVDGSALRRRYGLAGRRVISCVSRLVPRKGQDTLIRALPVIRRRVPDAALLIVGKGPYEATLRALAEAQGVAADVVFAGSVPPEALAAHYAAGEVFAMPCRARHLGMDVEGLGIVFLEASAAGRPVVAGDSGGAPDAVRDGRTGYLVDGRDPAAVADRIASLLEDRDLAAAMGRAGRDWVEREWRWDVVAGRLTELLNP